MCQIKIVNVIFSSEQHSNIKETEKKCTVKLVLIKKQFIFKARNVHDICCKYKNSYKR